MSRVKLHSEQGQAIVLIALAIVALVGFTALAIDGGNAYSDRRHAQNAADTAVLSAALAKIHGEDWQTAGLKLASSNDYSNSNPDQDIYIHSCDDISNPNMLCPSPFDGDDEYVHVVIESKVDTFFAPVIGIDQMSNRVEAIARAKPATEMYFGNAIVSLAPDGKSTFELDGGINATVSGGGIFVNSDSDDCAFKSNGGGNFDLSGEVISVVGEACIGDIVSDVIIVDQQPPPDYSYLDNTCDGMANYSSAAHTTGVDTITPPANTPLHFSSAFPPNNITKLDPGIYCLDGAFNSVNGTLTGSEVTFVLLSDNLKWTGIIDVTLSSPTSGPTAGLLFYQPVANATAFSIAGTVDVNLTGLILIPGALVDITGSSDSIISGQIIAYENKLSGSSGFKLHYENSQNMDDPPQIELTK